jgi:hypothetical protein
MRTLIFLLALILIACSPTPHREPAPPGYGGAPAAGGDTSVPPDPIDAGDAGAGGAEFCAGEPREQTAYIAASCDGQEPIVLEQFENCPEIRFTIDLTSNIRTAIFDQGVLVGCSYLLSYSTIDGHSGFDAHEGRSLEGCITSQRCQLCPNRARTREPTPPCD